MRLYSSQVESGGGRERERERKKRNGEAKEEKKKEKLSVDSSIKAENISAGLGQESSVTLQ